MRQPPTRERGAEGTQASLGSSSTRRCHLALPIKEAQAQGCCLGGSPQAAAGGCDAGELLGFLDTQC